MSNKELSQAEAKKKVQKDGGIALVTCAAGKKLNVNKGF